MLLFIHMELLYKYIEELDTDTSINEFNIRDVQMKLPAIKHKWAGRQVRAKIEMSQLKGERVSLIDRMTDKLIEQSPVTITKPTAKQRVLSSDAIKQMDKKIQEYHHIIEFLEKTDKTLSSMTFDIRNLTEIMKLETQ